MVVAFEVEARIICAHSAHFDTLRSIPTIG